MRRKSLVVLVFTLIFSLVACESKPKETASEKTVFTGSLSHMQKTKNLLVFNFEKTNDSENEETELENTPKDEVDQEDNNEESSKPEHFIDETIIVSYIPKVVNNGDTYTGLASLQSIEYTIKDPYNVKGLSTESFSFSFGAAKDGNPHQITMDNQLKFDSFNTNALAWDNKTNEKVLYLTFDCGYEYLNLTSLMLDTLKEKGVSAAFFCTQSYLENAPEVVTRMIQEGHIVGNHSVTHPSNCPGLTKEELAKELLGVHNYLRVNFGYNSEYFRFPTGAYSESAIELVNSVGYKSVFWSIAHTDWDPEDQPGVDVSFKTVTSRLHPGAVILLHTTSPDNVEILGDFIDYARNQGYVFKTLDEYNYWK